MRLFKAHGLGNDYLVWAAGPPLAADQVVQICDRHRGVGGDGILEPQPTERADWGVRIWNPDGSVAEKSGNGLRIMAWWLHAHRGAPASFTIDTGTDVVGCEVAGTHVEIEMGPVTFGALDGHAVEVAGTTLAITELRIGNPHAVIWMDDGVDLDTLPWRAWGAALEVDRARFPDRTNVQIAQAAGPGRCRARIWERGAGETLASGSSACAVAAVAVRRGHGERGRPMEVEMPGGALRITVREEGVRLAGPVSPVGETVLDAAFSGAVGIRRPG